MKIYPTKSVHLKGTKLLDDKVYCATCGQDFDTLEEKREHEIWCEPLGVTTTPRPRVALATKYKKAKVER